MNDGTPTAIRPGSVGDATTVGGLEGGTAPLVPLAGYEIDAEIARGGMGVVYHARDMAMGREVAVKVLLDKFPIDGPTARRFVDEARITGQLQHPGIPPIHHIGQRPDGRPYLAMKLIRGRTLDELLKEREPVNTLAVFEAIAQAVGYAHAHGVVHRDLKPANVMVGSFGEVQVMDWGLAKVLAHRESTSGDPDATLGTEIRSLRDSHDETHAGSVLGTPAFMPPEQAIGAVDEVDAQSDVFGLGAILCVMLSARPPYVASDAESTRKLAARGKLDDAYAALAGCAAEPDLVALCKRCLSAEKANRPTDGNAVAKEVASFRRAAEERARQAEVDKARTEVRATEARVKLRMWGFFYFMFAMMIVALWPMIGDSVLKYFFGGPTRPEINRQLDLDHSTIQILIAMGLAEHDKEQYRKAIEAYSNAIVILDKPDNIPINDHNNFQHLRPYLNVRIAECHEEDLAFDRALATLELVKKEYETHSDVAIDQIIGRSSSWYRYHLELCRIAGADSTFRAVPGMI
jgi:serine/threonine protein kinase